MPRSTRYHPPHTPQHIIQRGNNRQFCFICEQDYAEYANYLHQYATEFDVAIHAWVFMNNHVHLLATPQSESAIPLMMQSLGRRYVKYFNRKHHRSGSLWEGRYKSCLVQCENYLLTCQRYIELNPVRAGMVEHPAQYRWSSYTCHAMGLASGLHTPHREYQGLGTTRRERLKNYRALFEAQLSAKQLRSIRQSVQKEYAFGDGVFRIAMMQGRQRAEEAAS